MLGHYVLWRGALEIVPCPRLNLRLATAALGRCNFCRTSRFGGLPDLFSFYCCVCDEWHVEEGDAGADELAHRGAGWAYSR